MTSGREKRFTAKSITRIAILSAVSIIFLTLVRLSPVADLVFLTLSSFCVAAAFILGGRRDALFTYLVTSLISLIIPGWFHAWPYYIFFGLYPLLKSAIECFSRDRVKHHASWHFLLKFLVALVLGVTAILILNYLVPHWFTILAESLPLQISRERQVVFLLGFAVLAFFVYDFALSALIGRFQCRPRP